MSNLTITIYDEDGKTPRLMFPAPGEKYIARSLWVFLVDNLRPGFVVELGNEYSEITRPSGQRVPIELYESLMEGQKET